MKKHSIFTVGIIILAAAALIAFIAVMAIIPMFAGSEKAADFHKNVVEIDYNSPEGEICYGASGWLYGMSENGIPSGDLLNPLSPAVAVAKAPDGLQHPVGDVQNVGEYYLQSGGDYLMIYLQDIFPDWYYIYEGYEDYASKVDIMIDKVLALPYGDKVACCPFNECDNGAWYGKFKKKSSRMNFYKAWNDTYKLIKSKAPDMKIAGPGYMEYKHSYIYEFMEYCARNDCLPDIIIWHELSNKSYYEYQENYADYRKVEKSLGIAEIEICISEYGQPSDNGVPGKMIQYVSDFESTKVTACLAFWRLADNFSELAADVNTPTPAWWLYYRYGQMRGNTYRAVNPDPKSSHFRALTSYDVEKGEITILAGGEDGNTYVELSSLDKLAGLEEISTLYATLEYVEYEGLGGECLAPKRYASYPVRISNGKATLNLSGTRADQAFFITLSSTPTEDFEKDSDALRFEAEKGSLKGLNNIERSRAVPKPNYAVSNKFVLLPAGEGKRLELEVNVPESGDYLLKICYGNGYKDDGRATSYGFLETDDGNKIDFAFQNTLSYTTTGNVETEISLTAGRHIFSFGCTAGKVCFDFIDLVPLSEIKYTALQNIDGRFMFVVKNAGYYTITADENAEISFQGESFSGTNTIYLTRGVNLLEVTGGKVYQAIPEAQKALDADISLVGDFQNPLSVHGLNNYVSINVNAPAAGTYAINIPYANDSEFGTHDYNVKLVERYATIQANGSSKTVFFRNTYGIQNFSERVIYITLRAGANNIKIFNDNAHNPDTPCAYLPLMDYDKIQVYKACIVNE